MTAINLDVLTALGQPEAATQVQKLLSTFGLTERYEDPPLRHYWMSRSSGLSFLFEGSVLLDIQVFVQHTKSFAAYPFELPLGLRKGMTQVQVHQLLDEPATSDRFNSSYVLSGLGARLLVEYDTGSAIRYLSFESVRTTAL